MRPPAALLLCALALPATAGQPAPDAAATLRLPNADESPEVRIRVVESHPPKFVFEIVREMPTPGWRFRVDDVEFEEAQRRIVARVTEVPPEGMVAQVITPTALPIPLGRVARGRWFLEIRSRRDPGQPHQPAQAYLLIAQ